MIRAKRIMIPAKRCISLRLLWKGLDEMNRSAIRRRDLRDRLLLIASCAPSIFGGVESKLIETAP